LSISVSRTPLRSRLMPLNMFARRIKSPARSAQNRKRPRSSPKRPNLYVERLEERVLLDSAANRLFVAEAYRDLLSREPDPGGLAGWSGALDQGLSRSQFVLNIEGSLEYRTDLVQTLYQTFLGRAADSSGLNNFVTFLGS